MPDMINPCYFTAYSKSLERDLHHYGMPELLFLLYYFMVKFYFIINFANLFLPLLMT
jgi:hypothetical protein